MTSIRNNGRWLFAVFRVPSKSVAQAFLCSFLRKHGFRTLKIEKRTMFELSRSHWTVVVIICKIIIILLLLEKVCRFRFRFGLRQPLAGIVPQIHRCSAMFFVQLFARFGYEFNFNRHFALQILCSRGMLTQLKICFFFRSFFFFFSPAKSACGKTMNDNTPQPATATATVLSIFH